MVTPACKLPVFLLHYVITEKGVGHAIYGEEGRTVCRGIVQGLLGCKRETNARAKQDWNAIKAARLLYIRYRTSHARQFLRAGSIRLASD